MVRLRQFLTIFALSAFVSGYLYPMARPVHSKISAGHNVSAVRNVSSKGALFARLSYPSTNAAFKGESNPLFARNSASKRTFLSFLKSSATPVQQPIIPQSHDSRDELNSAMLGSPKGIQAIIEAFDNFKKITATASSSEFTNWAANRCVTELQRIDVQAWITQSGKDGFDFLFKLFGQLFYFCDSQHQEILIAQMSRALLIINNGPADRYPQQFYDKLIIVLITSFSLKDWNLFIHYLPSEIFANLHEHLVPIITLLFQCADFAHEEMLISEIVTHFSFLKNVPRIDYLLINILLNSRKAISRANNSFLSLLNASCDQKRLEAFIKYQDGIEAIKEIYRINPGGAFKDVCANYALTNLAYFVKQDGASFLLTLLQDNTDYCAPLLDALSGQDLIAITRHALGSVPNIISFSLQQTGRNLASLKHLITDDVFKVLVKEHVGAQLLFDMMIDNTNQEITNLDALVIEQADSLLMMHEGVKLIAIVIAKSKNRPDVQQRYHQLVEKVVNKLEDIEPDSFAFVAPNLADSAFNSINRASSSPFGALNRITYESIHKKMGLFALSASSKHLKSNFKAMQRSDLAKQYTKDEELRRVHHSVIEKEHELHQKGYYTFIHGQRRGFYLPIKLYTMLWAQKHNKDVGNFLFIHMRELEKEFDQASYDSLLHNGRKSESDRNRLLFMNYALFGNESNFGSNSAYYIAENHNAMNYVDQTIDVATPFKLMGYERIFSKYEKQLIQLQKRYEELSNKGNGLVIGVPPDKLSACVYPALSGGYKRKIDIEGVGSTADIRSIMDTLYQNPEKIKDTNQIEFCMIMTPQAGLDPDSGIEVYPILSGDPERLAQLQHDERELFSRISRDIAYEKMTFVQRSQHKMAAVATTIYSWIKTLKVY